MCRNWRPERGALLLLPPGNAGHFKRLQAAETFCLEKPQEFGEAGIGQVLECMHAFTPPLTHQIFIEYALWARIIRCYLVLCGMPFTSEEPPHLHG